MWPIRAQRLTDMIPPEELRLLLSREGAASSAVTACEVAPVGDVTSVHAQPHVEIDRPDPFYDHYFLGNTMTVQYRQY